ncbi:amidohydrolase [Staphylothermus hellenicus]|uniref:Amidohydrolase 3 n=1 Tax=Staphylothermus hellenicus (strain DSM 12710 / JCM 10830 / BK20S6-10-b1 / P8) TaxID=591019 RepID=D7D8K2_STAHD|nr:amidohydrolase [Staphylothermus hellenicus]ADI32098.1 Amidohydrolase 3 [Staphylothermus hellenicus DSM 12710]
MRNTYNYRAIIPEKSVIASYKPFRKCEAVFIADDQIVLCRDKEAIMKIAKEIGVEPEHYSGVVGPGFIDAHMHVDSLGILLSTNNLENISSRKELLEKIAAGKKLGEWIIGRGFDHNLFIDGKKPPTLKDLDSIFKDKPVFIIHKSGHMGIVNSVALDILLEISNDTVRNKIDMNNGWIFEEAVTILYNYIINSLPFQTYMHVLEKSINYVREKGVVGIGVAGCNWKCLEALKKLDEHGKIPIHVHVYMFIHKLEEIDRVAREALISKKYYRRLRINGVKIILDGALGTRTAYLSQPYSDDQSNKGALLYDPEHLEKIMIRANSLGLQLAVHCIGDACLDHVLNVLSEIGMDTRILRHRIEHASLVRDDQLRIINDIKPVIVVQPRFILSDKWLIDRIGYERVRWAYRFKSLSEKTIMALSTDSPVEPVDPRETIYAAITRGINEDLSYGIITSNEKMDLIDALYAYTHGSAYALNDEKLGCLYEGCYANPILMNKNPLTISDPREILSLEIKPL